MRQIRSFVRREGRITTAQRRALADLWPRYGVADSGGGRLDLRALFGRTASVILEIGFGDGQSLCAMAAAHPEQDYLGVEIHRPGVGRLLRALEAQVIGNVRVICEDACSVLANRIQDAQLQGIHLFFPDPWPKVRHHKRRLVQPDFVQLLRLRLVVGGYLHLATDWEHYAQHMMTVLSEAPGFENACGSGSFAPRPQDRPFTKFERRGQRLGHGVWELIFRRTS
ncbi:MAG: tRNA (guanosine(46)-N7)-methyltransferase TrmB [Acidiferrobacterales bacterium]